MSGEKMGCERCKRRDELDYCNLDDREKHFLMFMVDGCGREMTIPEDFLKRFRGEIPKEIKLEARNGHIYTVGVAKYPDKLVLRAGWETFVETYGLQIDDSVVFRYNGNSQFNVIVFDRFGREKASSVIADSTPLSPYVQERHIGAPETLVRSHGHSLPPGMQSPTENVNISQGHPQLMRVQPHTDNVSRSQGHAQHVQMQLPTDNMRRSEGHPQPIQMQSPSANVDHFVDDSRHMQMQPPTETLNRSNCQPQSLQMQLTCAERQSNLQRNKSNQGNKSVASSSGTPSQTLVLSYRDSLCLEDDTNLCETSRYTLGWNTRLNPAQKKKVDQKVEHIPSDNPTFVAMMSKCNVTGTFTLSVPKQYVKRHVGDTERNICLQCLGKRWEVQFGGRPEEKRIISGWRRFVKDNDVEMGDICIFELLKKCKTCTMEVHIIHTKDIDTPSKICQQRHREVVKIMEHSHSLPQLKEMQLRNETVEDAIVHPEPKQIQPPSLERRIRLQRDKSSQGSKRDSLSSEDTDHEEGALPDCILARFTRLTTDQKKAVKEKVQFTDSETPIFVAMMQQTNVTGRYTLSLSKKYINKYLGDEVRSICLERLGERCQVWFGRRPQDKRIIGGWTKFVKANEVEVGDICLFELLKHRKLCAMKVHIIRAKDFS
ncbi:putative B3 domain-containing protein Os08g0325100 [Triticum dicoccoides]|uniref:putative B3 domain-containing protein Os08g0325100 n=1 Tax=Triticum dicoccoides TaxID=85692 RepID=UPI00188FB47A|nr:putative B3 domain-containing protein Os08g0325100 [Triticum dicoccoides]